jgi:beta-lactamase regulating signal transducer with metallopeptidase domain
MRHPAARRAATAEGKIMNEHITRMVYYMEVHLLYASFVCCVCWLLTSIRDGSATTKYWIWAATSLNFILPVGAIVGEIWASRFFWARPLGFMGALGVAITDNTRVAMALFFMWLGGGALMFARLFLRLRSDRLNAESISSESSIYNKAGFLAQGIPVRYVAKRHAPAVNGVLHPQISLPDGIEQLLDEPELNAVLIHELTHARRRDNLIRLMHEIIQGVLWFHPLVWFTGSRLALYRELSCDESVIQRSHGGDLVSALEKLANPERSFLLEATVSSFLSHRIAQLAGDRQRKSHAANTIMISVFCAALLSGIFSTVAHTACCFLARK